MEELPHRGPIPYGSEASTARPGSGSRSRRTLAMLAALLGGLLALPTVAGASGERPVSDAVRAGTGLTFSAATDLTADMVHATFEEGVSVVVPRGSRVDYEETEHTDENGRKVTDARLAVTPPPEEEVVLASEDRPNATELSLRSGMLDAEQIEDASSVLAESGISVEEARDLSATGLHDVGFSVDSVDVTASTPHFSDGCAEVDNAKHWMYGCYKRYAGNTTSSGRYYGQSSIGTAKSKSHWMLVKARTHHDYNNGNGQLREWRPTSAINRGSCGNVSLGLTYRGMDIGVSGDICPSKLEPSVSSKHFWGQWQSSWGAWRSARDTEAIDAIYSANTGATGFRYYIYLQSRA